MYTPVNIGVQAGGEQIALYARGLELFAEEASDMSKPLAMIGANLMARVRVQFESEGAAGMGNSWMPLSETYGAWKAKHGPGVPILVGLHPVSKGTRQNPTRPQSYTASGAMRRSLLDPADVHVTPRRMLYSPTDPKAGYHQTGTSKMPRRPLVELSLSALHIWDRYFAVWLNELRGKP